jgi:class I fructose-bisphosphate aldolase|nr:fructose-bisphosphate aldolase [Deltaproteobacteria bacterium]
MIGKQIRLERIINRNTGRTIVVPMDHGVSVGPIEGVINMKTTIDKVATGGANAILIHKGIVREGHRGEGKDVGMIIHLSASTSLTTRPNRKTLVCSVEEAIKLGADGVSVHVNIGSGMESDMLYDFGAISESAMDWGMPLLAMVYPRGEKIKDEHDVDVVKHAARLGAELGADIVKVNYTGTPDTFREVVEGCPVPVVIAGGPKMDSDRDVLTMVKDAVDVGGAGVSIGRNVFQHKDPTRIVQAFDLIIHQNASVDEAIDLLRGKG